MVETFKAGFIGSATDEAALWVAKHCEGVGSICVPFTGSSKILASMAQAAKEGVEIDSWDVAMPSHAIVNGIFAKSEPEITFTEPKFLKGRMYETRYIRNIDAKCAGLFDYIAEHGSLYEKSAIMSATLRSTLMGRGTDWTTDFPNYWKKYSRLLERNAEWVNLNKGKFKHTLGNFYESVPTKHYDVVQVDPPKVVSNRDVYSKGPFERLNYCMHGPVEIPKWTRHDAMGRMRITFDIKASKLIFLYVTGVRPTPEEVERVLPSYGEVVEVKEFHHRNRSDIGYVVMKDNHE